MKIDDPMEKTLKSITSFRLSQNKDIPYNELIDKVIKDNNFERICPASNKNSLMSALSLCIFHREGHEGEILYHLKNGLVEITNSHETPIRLFEFKSNKYLLKAFLKNPLSSEFTKVKIHKF